MSFTPAGKCSYKLITRAESLQLPDSWHHCCHVILHAPLKDTYLFNSKRYEVKHAVLMQMRFDGRLGFPGGYVDDCDPSLEDALLRELNEEMGLLPKQISFQSCDYLFCHLFNEKKLCLHFFAKQLTFDQFLQVEKRDGEQRYGGYEVLGVVRVPLYVTVDRRGGFPAFLRNNFIGNSKDQLIEAIRMRQLLSEETLLQYISLSQETDNLSSN